MYKDQQGNTLLHLACKHDQIEIVRILLQKQIDTECLNKGQQSAFQIAYEMGAMDICYLIQQTVLSNSTPTIEGCD